VSNPSQQALSGRLPVLPDERIYTSYGSMLWTTAVISAASYGYLIGTTFPSFGSTRLLILGYLIGLILGETLCLFAVGVPSFRYGLDSVDAAKAALGTRGAVVLLIMVLATSLGWAYVLMAMTSQGLATLLSPGIQPNASSHGHLVTSAALGLLLLVWYLARRGAAAMDRLSRLCAPGQILIALALLGLIAWRYGAHSLVGQNALQGQPVTHDTLTQLAFGVEFGFDNGLTMLPFLGGLTRLVRHKRHLVGPTLIGSAVLGASFVAAVAALAADVVGGSGPTVWIIKLAGTVAGSVMVGFLLIANLGTLVVFVYVASVAIQQVRAVAALHWDLIITLTLLPGAVFAFHTEWLLSKVMTWLAYNGVMFVGLAAVLVSDFFLLRHQRLRVSHVFARPREGIYWYWGGVNWIAITVILGCGGIYLALFNPVSLRVSPFFRYAGAGIPAVAIGIAVYYLAMRLIGGNSEKVPKANVEAPRREPIKVGL
jgi:nucleobase:cation symporter-1, NCS1 family